MNLFQSRYILDPYKIFHPFEFGVRVRVRVRVLAPVNTYYYTLWSYYGGLQRRYAITCIEVNNGSIDNKLLCCTLTACASSYHTPSAIRRDLVSKVATAT